MTFGYLRRVAKYGSTMRTKNPADGITGEIVGPEPADEREHFMKCPDCGQYFDMRELGQVFHHNEPGHEPIKTN